MKHFHLLSCTKFSEEFQTDIVWRHLYERAEELKLWKRYDLVKEHLSDKQTMRVRFPLRGEQFFGPADNRYEKSQFLYTFIGLNNILPYLHLYLICVND